MTISRILSPAKEPHIITEDRPLYSANPQKWTFNPRDAHNSLTRIFFQSQWWTHRSNWPSSPLLSYFRADSNLLILCLSVVKASWLQCGCWSPFHGGSYGLCLAMPECPHCSRFLLVVPTGSTSQCAQWTCRPFLRALLVFILTLVSPPYPLSASYIALSKWMTGWNLFGQWFPGVSSMPGTIRQLGSFLYSATTCLHSLQMVWYPNRKIRWLEWSSLSNLFVLWV